MKERKIGIIGGTFNPIHYAHLLLAENAREQFALDRVVFIPAGVPYLKDCSDIPAGELRYQLAKIATKDNPYFTCSRIEIDRAGNTYTIDTVRELKRMYPGDSLYFIMGADSVFDPDNWHEVEELYKLITIIATVRKDVDEDALENKCEELREKYSADIRIFSCGRMDISSTDIRRRMNKGMSVRYLLPDDCIDFIRTRNIYSEKKPQLEAPSKVYIPHSRKQ